MNSKNLMIVSSAIIANALFSCRATNNVGSDLESKSTKSNGATEQIIQKDQITIVPVNGGINPDFGGYKIDVKKVMLGMNKCLAGDGKAEIVTEETATTLTAKVVINNFGPKPNDRCTTREVMPVITS